MYLIAFFFYRDASFHVPGVQQLGEEPVILEALQERYAYVLCSPGSNTLVLHLLV